MQNTPNAKIQSILHEIFLTEVKSSDLSHDGCQLEMHFTNICEITKNIHLKIYKKQRTKTQSL